MTADPVRTLSLDALPELLAQVPALVREVAELRAEVESIKSRNLVCPKCGSTNFNTTKTAQTERGVRRLRRCRGCGERVTTHEVIG